jgi:hypothetical protein
LLTNEEVEFIKLNISALSGQDWLQEA